MSEVARDVLIRALKTFWQAALASLAANFSLLADAMIAESGWQKLGVSVAVGALAAGFSAAYNGVVKPLLEPKR